MECPTTSESKARLTPAASELPAATWSPGLFGAILSEAHIMRRVRPDSLAVAVRPDPQTELMLRLTEREGLIEADARCERGDLELLNSCWAELQRSLQLHGVQLLDLNPGSARTPANHAAIYADFSQTVPNRAPGLSYSPPAALVQHASPII